LSTLLLEIGTEELPADFARQAPEQLEQMLQADLASERLAYTSFLCSSTPRRLVLLINELASEAEDLQDERKGPPAGLAFTNGEPTAAAIGFAQRCGLTASELEIRETAKGPFIFATVLQRGRSAKEILCDLIPNWLSALQGRRFMRWGDGDRRFSRPLRWLVALLDDELLPISLADTDPPLEAGYQSRGHRLHKASLKIASANNYLETIATAGVLVSRRQRAEQIKTAVFKSAEQLGGKPDLPEGLLQELIDLVEAPQLIQGEIPQRFLDLPAEVLSMVMRTHQRYVPLYDGSAELDPLSLVARGLLLPSFLFISNGLSTATATIRKGNERVLKARLADAEFFLKADLRVPSGERHEALGRVTFADGLGTVLDRCDRLEWIAEQLLAELPLDAESETAARRAAKLCKHDLVSQMVGEFPELQGVIGGKYLLAEGELRAVALAVLEHYQPRGADDQLPASMAGCLVAIADRLELLISIFAKGERPTGSSDPYALRRAGNGLLQIIWQQQWRLDLTELLGRSAAKWALLLPDLNVETNQLQSDLLVFLQQRLASQLEEQGYDTDLVQSVVGDSWSPAQLLRDSCDLKERLSLLQRLREGGRLNAIQAVVQRASRLAEKACLRPEELNPEGQVNSDLFEKPCEAAMLQVLQQLAAILSNSDQSRYLELAEALAASAETLTAFFDGEGSVMVMIEDQQVRSNRLNLLAVLSNQARVLADFSVING
jgi:glycyl-tRNA synthetase beta chain